MMKGLAQNTTDTSLQQTCRTRSGGFVLLTALILVLILTILALAGVALNSTQTRVAANTAAQDVSFQAAEGALNQAQTNLLNGNYPQSAFNANNNGLYIYNQTTAPIWTTVNWSSSSSAIPVSNWSSLASGVSAYYIIELMPPVAIPGQSFKTPAMVYRITAYATQASGGSPVMLQGLVQIQL
jgi:type IV pilus assembly protein PilX